jgi:hypothetical protein
MAASLLSELFYYSAKTRYTEEMFEQMWNYDKNLFIRTVFYLRQHRSYVRNSTVQTIKENGSTTDDIPVLNLLIQNSDPMPTIPTLKQTLRKVVGRGERKIFYQVIRWMSYHKLPELINLLPYIPDYGYWKDLLILLGTPAETHVINMFATQLIMDYQSFHRPVPGLISMAAKWTPNEGSSYDRNYGAFGKIAQVINISRKALRKYYLVPLRRYLSVTEQIVAEKRWIAINYNMVPQRSLQLHGKIFETHDSERYFEYINRSSTEYFKKLQLPPLVSSILNIEGEQISALNCSAEKSPSEDRSNSIYGIDISGSMTGFPITLAACMCIESGNQSWIPFLFEADTDGQEKLLGISGQTYVDQINNILATQIDNTVGMNLEICIKLTRLTNKRHLIIISNTLLDISEIPPLDENIHLTYWSINTNPITIQDYLHCTIIEGYDLNIYLELREGNILSRDSYKNIIMETTLRNNMLPLI